MYGFLIHGALLTDGVSTQNVASWSSVCHVTLMTHLRAESFSTGMAAPTCNRALRPVTFFQTKRCLHALLEIELQQSEASVFFARLFGGKKREIVH